jgi:hypothetical protein
VQYRASISMLQPPVANTIALQRCHAAREPLRNLQCAISLWA